jgi:FAD/FMN-containing dehydrogenase
MTATIAEALRAKGVDGLIDPTHREYAMARRVWNGDIDRRPAMIVRCRGAADVMAAVNVARDHRMKLAIRGGGHNAAGYATCDDGLVIDLSPMKGIVVDPKAQAAVAQTGVLWSELDRETEVFGLATPGGMISNTGIAGLTLGGGLGWLMGKYGLAVDNVLRLDVVTADGAHVRADPGENADLFWALRGGGGNFGVVTAIEYRLHGHGPMVLGGLVAFPMEKARKILRFYRDFSMRMPDEAECHAGMLAIPGVGPIVAILIGYNGDLEAGERFFKPLRAVSTPVVEMVGPMPHTARQCMLDKGFTEHGTGRYWKSGYTDDLSDDFIDLAVRAAETLSSPASSLLLFRVHGQAARVPSQDTAFAKRGETWDFNMIAQWFDPSEADRHKAWVREHWSNLQSLMSGAAYMNHLAADDGADRVRLAFGANFPRLARIKAKYDPDNLFRLNPNILPHSDPSSAA